MAETRKTRKTTRKNHQDQNHHPQKPPSWSVVRSLFTCKHHQPTAKTEECMQENRKKCKKVGCSGSFCSIRDHTGVVHTQQAPPPGASSIGGGCNSSNRNSKAPLNEINGVGSSSRGMNLRRMSGCIECHTVVDPIIAVPRDASSLRATPACTCPDCSEVFTSNESLELHQAVRHAVSELGPEDSSRNVVEIIFQSSWLKKPVCKIDRILKVHNTQKTINRFEEYRNSIKAKVRANRHPRCTADGNELLRFHCTSFICSIGSNGSTNLCNLIPKCNVCSIIKNGFKIDGTTGIYTAATSGRAHDNAQISSEGENRAMLVCRVIAGRVKRNQDVSEEFDSVAGHTGTYSNLDDLYVFCPKAILPCFVVIYRDF